MSRLDEIKERWSGEHPGEDWGWEESMEAIPWLIAKVERLQKENERLKWFEENYYAYDETDRCRDCGSDCAKPHYSWCEYIKHKAKE